MIKDLIMQYLKGNLKERITAKGMMRHPRLSILNSMPQASYKITELIISAIYEAALPTQEVYDDSIFYLTQINLKTNS